MTVLKSPFITQHYKAERNILRVACYQHAFYLSKVLDNDKDTIFNHLINYIKAHSTAFQSRKATILLKDKNGDRQVKIAPLSKVLQLAEKRNYHFSPSMVGYTNTDEEECINSIGTRLFIKNRSFYKNMRQKAAEDGDNDLYAKYDKLQNAFKLFNNAQSGSMSTEGTPISNRSGHTTLTSTGRCLTSITNLTNEQFITGNRFFNTPQNTLQSITARILSVDFKSLETVMGKYNLVYPTNEDLFLLIKHCSKRYWESNRALAIIKEYIDKLTPLEIASVIYTLDLVSLYRFNETFMVKLFDDWTKIPDNSDATIAPENKDKYILAISKLPANANQENINKLNAYHNQLEEKYSDFFHQFFRSPIPPTGLYDVTSSIRDCVLTSDTDSCIYTLDNMIEKYTDNNIKGIRLNAVLTYFIRMIAIDQHIQFSININVAKRNQRLLEMKNEYYFGAYVTTLMSKHYYALQRMIEGVVKKRPEMEIKGSNLRSSKIAKPIREAAVALMERIINSLENKELLDPAVELHTVANLERTIIDDLQNGNWSWLGRSGIKGAGVYKNPMSSAYFYHELWETVFAPKYGQAPTLPYVGIKVNVDLDGKTKINNFIDTIEDRELAQRFKDFIIKTNRDKFDSLILPQERLQSLNDIPKEVKDVMNMREIIKQNLRSVYAVLESAGLYFINESISRLVSDEH